MSELARRDDLDPLTRAVSDTLDELLFRHHGISTSWSNPESFIKWLAGRGYAVVLLEPTAVEGDR